eukprot:gene6954-16464_t
MGVHHQLQPLESKLQFNGEVAAGDVTLDAVLSHSPDNSVFTVQFLAGDSGPPNEAARLAEATAHQQRLKQQQQQTAAAAAAVQQVVVMGAGPQPQPQPLQQQVVRPQLKQEGPQPQPQPQPQRLVGPQVKEEQRQQQAPSPAAKSSSVSTNFSDLSAASAGQEGVLMLDGSQDGRSPNGEGAATTLLTIVHDQQGAGVRRIVNHPGMERKRNFAVSDGGEVQPRPRIGHEMDNVPLDFGLIDFGLNTVDGKRFGCGYPSCTYKSVRKGDVKKHHGVHGESKAFPCRVQGVICSKRFKDPSTRTRHEKTVHKAKHTRKLDAATAKSQQEYSGSGEGGRPVVVGGEAHLHAMPPSEQSLPLGAKITIPEGIEHAGKFGVISKIEIDKSEGKVYHIVVETGKGRFAKSKTIQIASSVFDNVIIQDVRFAPPHHQMAAAQHFQPQFVQAAPQYYHAVSAAPVQPQQYPQRMSTRSRRSGGGRAFVVNGNGKQLPPVVLSGSNPPRQMPPVLIATAAAP